jgi:hypothetical protein
MKNIRQIEALVDSISALKGWGNPESLCYRLRNPLLLRSFARAGKHEITEEGYRIFTSGLAGYKSCCFDVDLKINGASRAGLKPETSTLVNLAGVYDLKEILATTQIVRYLRRALQDDKITKDTPLSYFLPKD